MEPQWVAEESEVSERGFLGKMLRLRVETVSR